MHACTECADLRRQVAELEEVLSGAIYVEPHESRRLIGPLGVSQQQADLIFLLHKAKGRYVRSLDLGEGLPRAEQYGMAPRTGDEFRPQHYVTVVVAAIRRRLSKAAIENLQGYGYRLSDAMRQRVSDILNMEIRQ